MSLSSRSDLNIGPLLIHFIGFYINLPIGAVTIVILVFILKSSSPRNANLPIRQQIAQLDPLGFACFVPAVVCLLLALQWGGSTFPWNGGRIIALLVLFVILIASFIAIQILKPDTATVPPWIIKHRSVAAGFWYSICSGGAMIVMVYFLPLWFQAIQGVSAVESGIRSLPLVLALVVGSIAAGITVSKLGYYTPFLILGTVMMSIGAGLITTIQTNSGPGVWIGYQVVFGLGLGVGMQQPNIAAQTVLAPRDVPTGVSLMMFGQTLGGAVFISVAQNLFANNLVDGLAGVPGLNAALVVNTGATLLREVVAPGYLDIVLLAYNAALTKAYDVALGLACASVIGSLAMGWRSVKGRQGPRKPEGPASAEVLESKE